MTGRPPRPRDGQRTRAARGSSCGTRSATSLQIVQQAGNRPTARPTTPLHRVDQGRLAWDVPDVGQAHMVLDRLDECSIRLWPGRDDDGLTSRQSTAVDLMQQGVEVGELSSAGSGQQDPRVEVEVRRPVLPAREVHDEGRRGAGDGLQHVIDRFPRRRAQSRLDARGTGREHGALSRCRQGPHEQIGVDHTAHGTEIGPAEPFDVVDAARHVDPTAGEVEIDEQGCPLGPGARE